MKQVSNTRKPFSRICSPNHSSGLKRRSFFPINLFKNTLQRYSYNTLYTYKSIQRNMYNEKLEFLNWKDKASRFRENENFKVAGRRTSLIKEKSRIIKRSTLIEDTTPECEKAYRCRWSRDTKNSPLVLSVDTALLRASKKCQRGDKEWPRGCPRKLEEKAGC